jgi:photosystem II stability/assembly factor-like uncharacterized protein
MVWRIVFLQNILRRGKSGAAESSREMNFLKFGARDEKNSGEVLQILCAALYKTSRRAQAWMRGARPVVSVSEIPFASHISIQKRKSLMNCANGIVRLFTFLCVAASLTFAPLTAVAAPQRAKPKAEEKKTEEKKEEKKVEDPMNAGTFAGLRLRSIGPAFNSGRISSIAVDPRNRSRYFIAAASGGVWKTVNSGTTWTPVFENEASFSIGTVAIDPNNPYRIWVGTGENNSQRSVSYGDGVYRSDDDGKTWRNMGLKTSEHIARIVVDPRNSDVIYVAAQGPLWNTGGERGLFKTTDGGKTWNCVLKISENTGVTDVVADPRNPDTLIAATYQRRRHVWTLVNGGPECAIHKSTDAGVTWRKVSAGLPTVDMGRIGLAISPANPDVVYATIEAADRKGGIFRSEDRGETWEKRNDFDATAMYYATIVADPKDVDRIYVMNTFAQVSDDGGRTLRRLGDKSKHVDTHTIWIDPADANYYLVGCDGGVYESFDRAATWHFKANVPVTQFYDVTVDEAEPFYNIYGGTQDNNTLGGPSRTRSASGITNADWFITLGGDGFHCRVDPKDPNTVYSEYQYGALYRFDKRTGERIGIQPKVGKGEPPLRWNWDSPLIISPHSNVRLYFAANKLFRSDDRGDSWRAVSGDLTRMIDRDTLPVMGKIWEADAVSKHASTSFYGNVTALAESPKKEGTLWVGTDDGLIQVSEDGGASWRKIETFPGVPDRTYVSRILASQHDANTVYAAFDNHKMGDFLPYILKSSDLGRTWTSIAANLPQRGSALAIAEDHVNKDLLFVGTEFGVFFTIDGGKKWVQLKGDMPTIAVRDLAIQKRENDLVLATFGRGFYVLDDYTPLRALKPETLQRPATLFPVKDAWLYIQSYPLGGAGKSSLGESYFTANNPPFGATFTYFLKESLKSKKEKRREAERKGGSDYPTKEQLRAEAEEERPQMILTVSDAGGTVVRRLVGPASAGVNRVAWDLRFPTPILLPAGYNPEDDPFSDPPSGWLVQPGTYTVSIAQRVDGVTTPLAEPQKFVIKPLDASPQMEADRRALYEFQRRLIKMQRTLNGTLETAAALKSRLGAIKRALIETPAADPKLTDDAAAIDRKLNDLLRRLRGDVVLAARNENTPPSIADRLYEIVGEQFTTLSRPTKTHEAQYAIASEELQQALGELRGLMEGDVMRLEKAMEAAGAPYTPGRLPEWRDGVQ